MTTQAKADPCVRPWWATRVRARWSAYPASGDMQGVVYRGGQWWALVLWDGKTAAEPVRLDSLEPAP